LLHLALLFQWRLFASRTQCLLHAPMTRSPAMSIQNTIRR
jgi:hypothetical protein